MTIRTTLRVGSVIKEKRNEVGLTQEAMAAKMGVAVETFRSLENNGREPQLYLVDAAAEALGTTITALIFKAVLQRRRG